MHSFMLCRKLNNKAKQSGSTHKPKINNTSKNIMSPKNILSSNKHFEGFCELLSLCELCAKYVQTDTVQVYTKPVYCTSVYKTVCKLVGISLNKLKVDN